MRRNRRARGRAARVGRALTAFLATFVVAGVLGLSWLLLIYPDRPGPGRGARVEIHLEPGARFDDVMDALEDAGVLRGPRAFAAYARLRGADERLREGLVVLRDDLSPIDVLRRIATGYGSSQVRVIIPEGFTRFDVAGRLAREQVCDREAFLRVTEDRALLRDLGIDAPSLEGFLFPATYGFRQDAEPERVARRMVRTFRNRTRGVFAQYHTSLERLRRELGWGVPEVLTLASIVEKEAAVADERPMIAGVFLNRMRDPDFEPRRLQADPTVAYGCLAAPEGVPSCRGFSGAITRAMTEDPKNPYNTYRIERLPPGPIANPGLPAIRAVLAPKHHDYLYFVARGAGRHHFSATYDEHLEAVDRYRTMQAVP